MEKLSEKMVEVVQGLCRSHYPVCPFGCGKDGGPNCRQNIIDVACQPAKEVYRET
jgi:hypothetical protein